MENSLFQTFLLLAYFDISLIAITIANYAVSASYLGRETRLSRQRIERKEGELLKELNTLKKKRQIAEIENKIKESKMEKRRLRIRIILLSWLGAVILPSMFFVFSFVLAIVGINSEIILVDNPQSLLQQSMIFSVGTTAIGFMVLLIVIKVIDSAARSIPIPEFKVYFPSGLKKEKCKGNEKKEIEVCVENFGEDIAEILEIFIGFCPEFKVHPNPISTYTIVKQGIQTDYPDYNSVVVKVPRIHADTSLAIPILLTTPEEQGEYDIPIAIYEKKRGKQKDRLVIVVTE